MSDILDVPATEAAYRKDAARARLLPPLLAALAGLVTLLVTPRSASSSFFSTAAQIAPVPLLALAIEAKVLDRARLHGSEFARRLELARRIGDGITLAVLILGGGFALWRLTEASSQLTGANWVAASLAWGFVAVAALAVTGSPKPRLIATVDTNHSRETLDSDVTVGVGNLYGDTAVGVRLNLMVPRGHTIYKYDVDEAEFRYQPALEGFDRLEPDGEKLKIVWVSTTDIELPPGESTVLRFRARGIQEDLPVRAKFSNHLLPDGEINAYGTL